MNVYLSIPVITQGDRGTIAHGIARSVHSINKNIVVKYWNEDIRYDTKFVSNCDIFIFTHHANEFEFNKSTLPSGVIRELDMAMTRGKKAYLAYKTSNGEYKLYNFIIVGGRISGLPGTTNSLATFLDKNIVYEEIIINPCAEIAISIPVKEHSIDLRKNVQGTSYDRRLLL